jgi:hypothetical protein
MATTGVGAINVIAGAMIAQVSMLAIMFVGGLVIRRSDMDTRYTGRPTFSNYAWLILALALFSLALLGTSDAFSSVWSPLLAQTIGSIASSSVALLWVFLLDICVLTILVFGTGGRDSPFQPIYFLLPTLAIFLHESSGRVVVYLLLVATSFSISMLHSNPVEEDEASRWRAAYWFVSLTSFVLATTIGLMTRRL